MEKVVNKTVFSKDGFVSMNKAMVTRNLMSSALLQAVILIGIILSLVAKNWTMLAIFGAMFVIFPILLFVMYQNGIKKVIRSGEDYFDKIYYEFTFKKDVIEFEYGRVDEKENEELKKKGNNTMSFSYETIFKVIETNDYMFLLVAKAQGYTLEKQQFASEEEIEQVRTWLTTKGVRYIKKVK